MFISKKAALELSISTIVILVISITMLVLGIIFVRGVMCSGIQISEDLSEGVKNEIRSLFSADEIGVKCLGEGSQEIKLASGGRRKIICIIKTEEAAEYKLSVKEIKSIKGASDSAVSKWVIDKEWKGSISPGGKGKEVTALLLNIPKDAPTTTLKITIEDIKNNDVNSKTTHISYIDIVPAGFFRTTIC